MKLIEMYELLFPNLAKHRWSKINLDQEARIFDPDNLNPLLDPKYCQAWVEQLHQKYNCDFSHGGWLENRSTLWRGHYHKPGHMIHLGVDYNVPAGTEVRVPYDGRFVFLEKDPNQVGGWGWRAILKIKNLWVIFAHLQSIDLAIGSDVRQGELLGIVGKSTVNGGWFPHLHVQCLRDRSYSMDGYTGWSKDLTQRFPNPDQCLK